MALFKHTAIGATPGESFTFGVHTEGTGTLQAAQAGWVAAIGALWTGALDGIVSPDVQLEELTTASLDQATGGQISRVSTPSALVGVGTGEMLPFQCSVAVSFNSEFATRAGRGRMYLPPFDATTLDAGRLSSAAQATVVTAVNAWWGQLDTAGLALVLYGRAIHTVTPIVGGTVGDVIDTQRRRRNKLIEERSALTAP